MSVRGPRHRRGIGAHAIEREPPEIGPATRVLRCGLGEDVARQHQDDRTGATRAGGGDRHVQVVIDPAGSSSERIHFVHDANSAAWSNSWKALRSRLARGTSWTRPSIGTDAFIASAIGGTSSVAAGPFWAATTPIRPGDTRVAVGHHAARVLRPVGDLPNPDLRCGQEQRRGQALPEHVRDAVAPQPLGERVGHRPLRHESSLDLRLLGGHTDAAASSDTRPIPVGAFLRSNGYRGRVDLRRLQYFAVLAEELHFRRAAERLHIAQPGLSQQIRVLERELGATLFERTTAGVTLTDAGQCYAIRACPCLAEVERVAASVRAAAEGRCWTTADRSHPFARGSPARTNSYAPSVGDTRTPRSGSRARGPRATSPCCAPRRPTRHSSGYPLTDADDLRLLTLGTTELVVALPRRTPWPESGRTAADLHGVDLVSWPREQAPGYFDHVRPRCGAMTRLR